MNILHSTVLRARGGVWHKQDRKQGVVPHTSIDTEAGWTNRAGTGASQPLDGYAGEPPAGLGEQPEHITYEDERRFGESEYAALTPVWLHMDQNQIHENQGTCFGDSGGPAFWEPGDGTRTLVGITSWGDGACVVAGFDYRVDIPDTLDFIADNLP